MFRDIRDSFDTCEDYGTSAVTWTAYADEFDEAAILNADAIIIEGLYGFNRLGVFCKAFAKELGTSENALRKHCDWNTHHSKKLSIIVAATKRPSSRVRAVALCPAMDRIYGEHTPDRYWTPPLPNRDFFYSNIFESLRHLNKLCSPTRVSIGCLSGSTYHHPDITTCIINAIADFTETDQHRLSHVSFVGYDRDEVMRSIKIIGLEEGNVHREVQTSVSLLADQVELVELIDWDRRPHHVEKQFNGLDAA